MGYAGLGIKETNIHDWGGWYFSIKDHFFWSRIKRGCSGCAKFFGKIFGYNKKSRSDNGQPDGSKTPSSKVIPDGFKNWKPVERLKHMVKQETYEGNNTPDEITYAELEAEFAGDRLELESSES